MKTIYTLALVTGFAGQAFASAAKTPVVNPPKDAVDRIAELDQLDVDTVLNAYHANLVSLADQRRALKVDQVVAEVESRITKIVNEVVTQTRSKNAALQFTLPFGLAPNKSFSAGAVSEYDYTKFIVANPEEVANFPQKVRDDYVRLQQMLQDYVRNNLNGIVAMKITGIEIMAQAGYLLDHDQDVELEDLKLVEDQVTDLNFIGRQTITSCVQTNFAARASRRGLGFHEHLLQKDGKVKDTRLVGASDAWEQMPHSVKTCESSLNSASLKDNASQYRLNITMVDQILHSWLRYAGAKYYFGIRVKEGYPTFDLDLFK